MDSQDQSLVEALRRGDEAAFVLLIDMHHERLVRLAQIYLPGRATAEDVVQETWLAVLRGLDRFQGRSSLRTWIVRILINRARTRFGRESRSVPFSWLEGPEQESDEPAVDPGRFLPPDHPRWPRHWSRPPDDWTDIPEDRLLAEETQEVIRKAIQALPPSQREVVTLRDVDGWTAEEVCNALEIGETNQRVLLHRARAKVRSALERYVDLDRERKPA